MITAAGIVVNGFDTVEKEFITVTEIQKRAFVHEELDARLRSDRAGGVAVVPHQTNEPAQIWNNDVG